MIKLILFLTSYLFLRTMEKWNNGEMEQWRNGTMKEKQTLILRFS